MSLARLPRFAGYGRMNKLLEMSLFLWLVAMETVTSQDRQPDGCLSGWYAVGGYCFGFVRQSLSWKRANRYCSGSDATLASIWDHNEWNFIIGQKWLFLNETDNVTSIPPPPVAAPEPDPLDTTVTSEWWTPTTESVTPPTAIPSFSDLNNETVVTANNVTEPPVPRMDASLYYTFWTGRRLLPNRWTGELLWAWSDKTTPSHIVWWSEEDRTANVSECLAGALNLSPRTNISIFAEFCEIKQHAFICKQARPTSFFIGRRYQDLVSEGSRAARMAVATPLLSGAFMYEVDNITDVMAVTSSLTSLEMMGTMVTCADRCLAAPQCRYFEIFCITSSTVCSSRVCRFRG